MSSDPYKDFIGKVNEISYLSQVTSLLRWDQETYMPGGSVKDRAEQISLMAGIVHDRLTSTSLGKLIDELSKKELEEDQRVILREVKRDYDRATAIPPELVKEISKTETLSMDAWVKARKNDDFKTFEPWLEKMIGLKMKAAEHIGYEDHIYDALLDEYEPTMKTREAKEVLTRFRKKLVPLVEKIVQASRDAEVDDSCLKRNFPVDRQREFLIGVIRDLGYDFNSGRLDITTHPFTIGSARDVRITTRYNENDIRPALFSAIHEAGHGIYEQGHLEEYYHTPLATSASLGIHESQSRLYENVVGRSENFWRFYYPSLQETFPQIEDVSMEDWHRAINMVAPSFIRVESDEVTYNLHILLRFEMEMAISEGKLETDEIPQVWNQKMEDFLGIVPSTDTEGCLQDVHWSMGLIGYFPTYTLGNLLSIQLYNKVLEDVPDLETRIQNGDFVPLLEWLRENVHRHGRRYMYNDLCEKATGGPIDEDNFLNYLKNKFGPLFDVQL